MRANWLLPVFLLPAACATVESPAPVSDAAVPAQAADSLLVYRDRLCAGAESERLQWLSSLSSEADHQQQLQRLLLASCDLWRNREELQQALQTVDETQDWSADEAAFLRLLRSQHAALEQQRQETIRGISEIEDTIEKRPASGPPEGESQP